MLEIGRITRPHGVRGEVNVLLTSNRTERLDPGSVLETTNGPLEVRSSRPHKGGWLVRFVGVDDRDQAEAVRNLVLRPLFDHGRPLGLLHLVNRSGPLSFSDTELDLIDYVGEQLSARLRGGDPVQHCG